MLIIMYILEHFLALSVVIITISAISFFLFAKYRRHHDMAGVVQYTVAGLIFGMGVGNTILILTKVIMYVTPLYMYDIMMELGISFTLFAVAMVIVTGTETRRDIQELLKNLNTLSESEKQ